MNTTAQELAKRFREVILSGTWVGGTNYRAQLLNTPWTQVTKKLDSLNTIAAITLHIHYYISGILKVFEGGKLDIKDQFSFDFPLVTSQEQWNGILDRVWHDAEKFASLVEQMTHEKLIADFADSNYGSCERNINAMIEHSYYHLGQIVLIKKLVPGG